MLKLRALLLLLTVLAVVSAAAVHKGAVGSDKSSGELTSSVPLEYLPSKEAATFLSLGQRSALADLFWVRAVLYFHNEVTKYKQFEWLEQYIDIVTELDPRFVDIYRWGNAVLVFSRAKVTYESIVQSNRVIDMGLEAFPNNRELAASGLANCSAYVRDPSPEEKVALDACKDKYVEIGAHQEKAALFMVLLYTQKVAEENDALLCETVAQLYKAQGDEIIRKQLENRLKTGVCGSTALESLVKDRGLFEEFWTSKSPYLAPDAIPQLYDMKSVSEDGL